MKRLTMKGFTLIEMLVVVLIIGILAGVALPQYTKTVEKARLAEPLTILPSLAKAVDLYLLVNDYPNSSIAFLGDSATGSLDIDITESLTCDDDGCFSKNFFYNVYCNSQECAITAERLAPGSTSWGNNDMYDIRFVRKRDEDWEKKLTHASKYEYLGKYLESQGFEREAGCGC